MNNILVAQNIEKYYSSKEKVLHQISITIRSGESVGLIGESGCGKSTLARCLLLTQNIDSGSIMYQGTPVRATDRSSFKKYKGSVQAVFQNPTGALNPRIRLLNSLMEPLDHLHRRGWFYIKKNQHQRKEVAAHLLELVGLSPDLMNRYPHELSGGQKQRLCIARAISVEPNLIIMDEPTSNLDALIQSEILDLLRTLQKRLDFSYLFISHDLPVVQQMCDRILVMRKGQIVDEYMKEELFDTKRHPYTQQLAKWYD